MKYLVYIYYPACLLVYFQKRGSSGNGFSRLYSHTSPPALEINLYSDLIKYMLVTRNGIIFS